jgi:hypothetical protein
MIAQEIQEDYNEIQNSTLKLLDSVERSSNEEIVLAMKKIVPEFKSMNSVFETLDV